MALTPPEIIPGEPRVGLPYGLFSTFDFRSGSVRWENGVVFESLTCEPVDGIGQPECDPEETIGLPKNLEGGNGPLGEATPFTVYGHWLCSPVGYSVDHAQEMARQHLLAREEQRVEQALWTGDLGNIPNLIGQNGYPPPDHVGNYPDIAAAIAAAEFAFAQAYGSQGVMHMSRRLALLALAAEALIDTGGVLSTRLGTPVAAGSGYPDSPAIIVTPPVFGYHTEIIEPTDFPGDLFDRANNDLYGVAERTYLLGFDPCGAIQVNFTGGEVPNDPGGQQLVITLGSIPSSPIPDGTDTTIIAQTNIAPIEEVELFYQINGGAWQSAGEMTQVETLQFVYNVVGDETGPGDTVNLYAKSGTVQSNTITIEVT